MLLCSLFSLNAYSSDDDDDNRNGCYNSDEIMNAAHNYDRALIHFAQLLTDIGDPWSHISGDAIKAAQAARHLHEMTETGKSCGHIKREFINNVKKEFWHVRKQLEPIQENYHNGHVIRDFREVKWSFYYLRRTIIGWGDGGGHGNGYGNDY